MHKARSVSVKVTSPFRRLCSHFWVEYPLYEVCELLHGSERKTAPSRKNVIIVGTSVKQVEGVYHIFVTFQEKT